MLVQSLLAELQFEANNTRKLFNAIPDDVLDYKPTDFNWTIAELASHTAHVYNWWDQTLNQDVFEMTSYHYDAGDISNMASIKKRLEENIAKAVGHLENYPEERLLDNWTMTLHGKEAMPPMPRMQVIRNFLLNHVVHHRGEIIAHLRANGRRVPGLYGPSYEEQQAFDQSGGQ